MRLRRNPLKSFWNLPSVPDHNRPSVWHAVLSYVDENRSEDLGLLTVCLGPRVFDHVEPSVKSRAASVLHPKNLHSNKDVQFSFPKAKV